MAYSGSPILLEELLHKPAHSLIDQSMHSRLGATTTNGDGFGVGWYVDGRPPGVFRAATGTAVRQTNCHPFRHGRWLWVHNGMIRDFHQVKRDLVVAVDPSLYPAIEGSADSEVLFFLALTFGLEHDPPTAVERMVGFVEDVAGKQGIKEPLQMTVGTSDGDRVWAFRYSSEGRSRSLFYSTKLHTLRQLYPDNPILHEVAEETRLVVSEPLGDLAGAWNEVPESSYGVVHHGHDELHPFQPRRPWLAGRVLERLGPAPATVTRHSARTAGVVSTVVSWNANPSSRACPRARTRSSASRNRSKSAMSRAGPARCAAPPAGSGRRWARKPAKKRSPQARRAAAR